MTLIVFRPVCFTLVSYDSSPAPPEVVSLGRIRCSSPDKKQQTKLLSRDASIGCNSLCNRFGNWRCNRESSQVQVWGRLVAHIKGKGFVSGEQAGKDGRQKDVEVRLLEFRSFCNDKVNGNGIVHSQCRINVVNNTQSLSVRQRRQQRRVSHARCQRFRNFGERVKRRLCVFDADRVCLHLVNEYAHIGVDVVNVLETQVVDALRGYSSGRRSDCRCQKKRSKIERNHGVDEKQERYDSLEKKRNRNSRGRVSWVVFKLVTYIPLELIVVVTLYGNTRDAVGHPLVPRLWCNDRSGVMRGRYFFNIN